MNEQAPKVWTKEEIKLKLTNNDAWLYRGILAIYARQTAQEQSQDVTAVDNGIGFSGSDAFILSRFAKQLLDMKARNRSPFLTEKQLLIARKKMPKYAGQLVKIIQGKI